MSELMNVVDRYRDHWYQTGYDAGYEQGKRDATDINVGGKWVSVKDRLPEEPGAYLVNVHQETEDGESGDFVLDAWYWPTPLPFVPRSIGWTLLNEFYDLTERIKDDITHWMPRPKPPMDAQEGEELN